MSIRAITVLAAIIFHQGDATDAPTGWQAKHPSTLKNIPRIVETERKGDEVTLTAFNDGKTPLKYYSAGPDRIQEFQDTEENGTWKAGKWDWCGTGKSVYTIEPGKSAQLKVRFWNSGGERMLGQFWENDTERVGFVVLAIAPAK